MRDVAEILADLADHPPTPPRPVPDIRHRARRRRRARRARLTAAIASLITLALIAGALALDSSQEDANDVRISPRPDRPLVGEVVEAPFDPTIAVTEPHGLTVEPATGLRDGETVRVFHEVATLPAVCAAEVVALEPDDGEALTRWCAVSPNEDEDGTLRVSRKIRTPEGLVDCAQAPGRCVVVPSRFRLVDFDYAPITFAPGCRR